MTSPRTRMLTLLLTTSLVAFAACSRTTPKPLPPEIRYVDRPSPPCLRSRPKKSAIEPGLMICSNPEDYSKGSCARINVARALDAYEQLKNWSRLAVASCQVPERVEP